MTQTELANIALGLLGAETITDFTERTPAAEKVRRHWPIVRDALLRSKNWNFATRRSSLSADADNAPEFDWTYAYALPGDYLKAIEFNARQAGTGEAHFEISGRFLLSNDDTAALKYTARIETVSEWDSSFCDAFAHALAAALAPGLSTAPGLGLAMRQQAEDIVAQAGGPNAVETRPRVVLARTGSGWLAARLGGVDPSISTAAPVSGSSSSSSSSSGGTITLSGDATGSGTSAITVTLAATGVTAGSYTNANITVDSKGRVTAASNGSGGSGSTNLGATAGATTVDISSSSGTGATIPAATTSAAGVLTAADKTKLDAISGTNTGDQTITLSGDVTGSGTGAFAATIANDAVTNAKLANMAAGTYKMRVTGSTGDPEDATAAQATAGLNAMVGDSGAGGTKGLVPAPAAGDAAAAKYLKADGTWATVSGGGGSGTVTSVGASFTGGIISVGGSPVTTSGTLALTVAGTSGGIPYFSSSSAWASSAALTNKAVVIGGGAGAPPTASSILSVDSSAFNAVSLISSNSARVSIYCQNTNSSGNASFYFENNRGSLAAYGGLLIGGSADSGGTLFGLARADRLFLIADGASLAGMAIGTLTADSLVFGTNNATNVTIASGGAITITSSLLSTSATAGIGYATGAGGTVTQATSRTTGVTLNKVCGNITLVSAAGSILWQSFTVTNSAVAANDQVVVCQKSGTDKYMIHVTAVGAGSFEVTFATTGGTTTEQPVFNFFVGKAVAA